MSSWKRIGLWSILLAAAGWLGACFTEIGNAEDEKLVDAEFRIEYSMAGALARIPAAAATESVQIDLFQLGVLEGEFNTPEGKEFHLWKQPPPGLPADFTGKDKGAVLPEARAPSIAWEDLGLECLFATPIPLDSGRFDFDAFQDRGYIKGTYANAGKVSPFLFALPGASQLEFRYPRRMLDHWLLGGAYHLEFVFYAARWLAGAPLANAVPTLDRNGKAIVILDSLNNPAEYQRLRNRFLESFNTAEVFFHQDPD